MRLCFDSFFRLNVQFVFIAVILSLFYILFYVYFTVILFCFICSPLSTAPLQRNQCHPHVIQSCACSGFQCFPARVAICPDESLLLVCWNAGVVFTFTKVEQRLLLCIKYSFIFITFFTVFCCQPSNCYSQCFTSFVTKNVWTRKQVNG